MYMSLLQRGSTSISPTLPSAATLLFNTPTRDTVQRLGRPPILCDNDESNFTVLLNRQPHLNEDADTWNNIPFVHTESTVEVQLEDSRL